MTARTPEKTRERIRRSPLTDTEAARKFGLSRTTIARIRAEAPPFGSGTQTPARIPRIDWTLDQPAPPPSVFPLQPGYSDHTFKSFAAPYGFEGFTLERIRSSVAQHRQGFFIESSTLAVAILGFAPVLAALGQAVAPACALDRYIRGGNRGLAKLCASEIEAALVPRSGLLPSPYFPPTLWGSMEIYRRLLGFAVLQHVDGAPDEETGIRPRYTRLWPPWAVNYYRSNQKWIALTTDGPVEIGVDAHFTLVADEIEPHFTGAIVALGEEVLAGRLTQQARNSWINRYGNPKWVGIMPDKWQTQGPEGDAFFASLAQIIGPDGYGLLPFGSDFKTVGLNGEASGSFKEALDSTIIHIAMALLGSDGTIRAGGEGGAGPYRAPGFWGIRRDLVSRGLACIIRAVNGGHIAPYLDVNYAAQIAAAKRAGTWVDPVLDIPLPDPDADARFASAAERQQALYAAVKSEREAGGVVDQMRVDLLAARLGAESFALADQTAAPVARLDLAPTDIAKVVRVDEARRSRDLPPIGDERGKLTIAELEEQAKASGAPQGAPPDAPAPDGAQENAGVPPGAPVERVATAIPRGTMLALPILDVQPLRIEMSAHSVKFDEDKRHAVYIRDGYKCHYCGYHDPSERGKGLSIDHIDARHRGGAAQNTKSSPATNLITACGSCNSAKQDRTPRQWNQYQTSSGQAPPPTDWKKIRSQAAKKIDIKKGAENAAKAREARNADKAAKGGGGGREPSQGDEHHPPGTPHP